MPIPMETLRGLVAEAKQTAPFEYQAFYDDHGENVAMQVADAMQGELIGMTRLSVYLESRSHGEDHQNAAKSANKAVAAVRKALGYSIPRQDINF